MWIVDRKKEFIKYKGFQGKYNRLACPDGPAEIIVVAPAELEAILLRHPGVDDSGVIGVWAEDEATELPRWVGRPSESATSCS